MKPTTAVLYSDASSAALVHAIKAWRTSYAPAESYEGLIGGPVKHVEAWTKLIGNGRALVEISIIGKRPRTSDTYYYEATLAAGELKLESITE